MIVEREDMITPIREMTINQIMKRKDDLLVSGDDINEIATNVRNKTIDDFVERLSRKIKTEIDDCADELKWIDEISEQLKDKTKL